MQIYLDIDGVLAQFAEASQVVHNKLDEEITKWDFFHDWGISTAEFWAKIEDTPNFWENLEPYEWLQRLVGIVETFDPNYMLLTSPDRHFNCYSGKCKWIQQHLNLNVPKRAIFTSQKQLLSRMGRILIDDSDSNIDKWEKAGGIGILFPQPWNSNKAIENKVDYVLYNLDILK